MSDAISKFDRPQICRGKSSRNSGDYYSATVKTVSEVHRTDNKLVLTKKLMFYLILINLSNNFIVLLKTNNNTFYSIKNNAVKT